MRVLELTIVGGLNITLAQRSWANRQPAQDQIRCHVRYIYAASAGRTGVSVSSSPDPTSVSYPYPSQLFVRAWDLRIFVFAVVPPQKSNHRNLRLPYYKGSRSIPPQLCHPISTIKPSISCFWLVGTRLFQMMYSKKSSSINLQPDADSLVPQLVSSPLVCCAYLEVYKSKHGPSYFLPSPLTTF